MFRLDAVSKSYGGVVALDTVSLEIASGRTTALIGPSGCGKSTLLRLLLGLVVPDSGTVSVDGSTLDDAAAVERRLGAGARRAVVVGAVPGDGVAAGRTDSVEQARDRPARRVEHGQADRPGRRS